MSAETASAAIVSAIAAPVRQSGAPAPASSRNARAVHPRIGNSATYRMLSQWMKPETNVMPLPAEYGVDGKSPSVTTVIASVPHTKNACGRVMARRKTASRTTSHPASATRPTIASTAWNRGQLR